MRRERDEGFCEWCQDPVTPLRFFCTGPPTEAEMTAFEARARRVVKESGRCVFAKAGDDHGTHWTFGDCAFRTEEEKQRR